MSYEKSLETLKNLNKKFSNTSMNEADTRFQIIDKIIEYTFFWPSANIKMETKTNEGYTDYQLTNSNGEKTFLVIEAKKQKVDFNFSQYGDITNHRIKVKILLKDENTKNTILQVKNYCNDIGCKYACITNGHEWAFFRTYIDGKSWQEGNAYIFRNLQDIIDNFVEVNKYLTHTKIVNENSLQLLFDGIQHSSNERYEPKLKINGYDEQIANNQLDTMIRGYFDRFFGEIRISDDELLEKCYVAERGYEINFDKVTRILEDALSPYMENTVKLKSVDTKTFSQDTFTLEIQKIIIEGKKAKVLVLFGGKGAGKTTFLVNLFSNKQNNNIRDHSIIGYVNLLKVANDKDAIKNQILKQLLQEIDKDKLLEGSNDDLSNLFRDKYDVALKQSLDGLDTKTESFILKRNDLLQSYKNDLMYCLTRLSHYWRGKQKGIIINIDNTDQFDQALQDYCFSFASELAEKLHCISIISLREEKYVSSNIQGYLDAYEQNGFHISSPKPQQVFLKRLEFILNKIKNEKKIFKHQIDDINILFQILKTNLENEQSEFNRFMTAATHGNIRQGLELFKSFLFSNYTNINEMIKQGKWDITLHQIIKPIMIPIYRFYNEKISNSIPNIYKLRSEFNSSHFTAYRILNKLATRNDEYISVFELNSHFSDTFKMLNDCKLNIELLLSRGMVESENGSDVYDDNIQKIKITSFGYYMQEVIFKDLTYLELISVDLAVLDHQLSNEIIAYSNEEYDLLKKGQDRSILEEEANQLRYKRLEIRLRKVEKLIQYLNKQELAEVEHYSLNKDNLMTSKIIDNFRNQKKDALESAQKNLKINIAISETKHGIKRLD
ncbi:MAG: hypothetical protein PHO27_07275 [Sulfuricurvum sp.]|nr:hypothetical protein [Sulfuricurvum sp.]